MDFLTHRRISSRSRLTKRGIVSLCLLILVLFAGSVMSQSSVEFMIKKKPETQRDKLHRAILEELTMFGCIASLIGETKYIRDYDSTQIYNIEIEAFRFIAGEPGDSVYYVEFYTPDEDADDALEYAYDTLAPSGFEIVIPHDLTKPVHPKYIPPYDMPVDYDKIENGGRIDSITPCEDGELHRLDSLFTKKFRKVIPMLFSEEAVGLITGTCIKFVNIFAELGKNCEEGAYFGLDDNVIYLDTARTSMDEWYSPWGFFTLTGMAGRVKMVNEIRLQSGP